MTPAAAMPFATKAFLDFACSNGLYSDRTARIVSGQTYSAMPVLTGVSSPPGLGNAVADLVTPICHSGARHFADHDALCELNQRFERPPQAGFIQTRDAITPDMHGLVEGTSYWYYIDQRTNHRMPLGLDESAQLRAMKRDSRSRCRKLFALADAFAIEAVADDDRKRQMQFAQLHAATAQRLGFSSHYRFSPAAWHALLADEHWRLLLLRYQGRVVAGAVLADMGDGFDYVFVAHEPADVDLGRALLLWTYQWSSGQRPNGYLDLGGGLQEGDTLERFKLGMGGIPVPFKRLRFVDAALARLAPETIRQALRGRWP